MGNRKKIFLLALPFLITVVLLILGLLNRIAIANVQVGDYTGSMAFKGLNRTYLIHIPPSYDKTKSMPLVIALHGGGVSAEQMVEHTRGGFNTLSDREGFIVVYPYGINKKWNDGRKRNNIDDVGFISALIDQFAEEFNIDTNRVCVTGISNGAMMSYRLAIELSEKIAAIAAVAGNIPVNLSGDPKRPISILIINGTEDPLMPWEGGYVHFKELKLGEVLSTAETVEYWVNHNKCSPAPIISYEIDKDPQDGTRVRREAYGNCEEETEVILYAIEGGGHIWPGGYQYSPERRVGKTSKDIDANEVIWNFFKRHVRK
jgi:polyhydroxybutyrate depolymerase